MNWEYVAGFFDADGSTGIIKRKGCRNNTPYIDFSNTVSEVIYKIRDFLDKGRISSTKSNWKRSDKKIFTLRINKHDDILEVAEILLPLTIVKKEKLIEVIKYIKETEWTPINKLKNLSKEELYDLYWNQKLTIKQIARRFQVCRSSIRARMTKFGIPRRSNRESQLLRWKK